MLYHKDGSLSAEKIAASAEIAMFGCESRIDVYGFDLVAKWVADVCCDSRRVGEDNNLSERDKPLFEEKPKMRPEERHYERTRAVAAFLWSKNPNMTIADMIVQDEINGIACEGRPHIYHETTLRRWIKDLRPEGQPTGRPKGSLPLR